MREFEKIRETLINKMGFISNLRTPLTQFHHRAHREHGESPLKILVDSMFSVVRVFRLHNIS
jgi:hypothetical protein